FRVRAGEGVLRMRGRNGFCAVRGTAFALLLNKPLKTVRGYTASFDTGLKAAVLMSMPPRRLNAECKCEAFGPESSLQIINGSEADAAIGLASARTAAGCSMRSGRLGRAGGGMMPSAATRRGECVGKGAVFTDVLRV